jgi:NifB/MoaA-like Fe-S oxidoreductase
MTKQAEAVNERAELREKFKQLEERNLEISTCIVVRDNVAKYVAEVRDKTTKDIFDKAESDSEEIARLNAIDIVLAKPHMTQAERYQQAMQLEDENKRLRELLEKANVKIVDAPASEPAPAPAKTVKKITV